MGADDRFTADELKDAVRAQVADALTRAQLETLTTPVAVLRMMMYDIGYQMVEAGAASRRLLDRTDDDLLWQDVQLMTTHATTGANYIWPLRPRNHDPAPYTHRGRDVQHLLQVDKGELVNLRGVRDGISHLDERIERWVHQNPGRPLSMRPVRDGPPTGAAFLAWDRTANALWFLDTHVDVIRLAEELDLIQRRATAACFLLMHTRDVDYR